jgi:hypothetical protein
VAGPTNDLARPAGQWNEARIVRRGLAIEHWLNDQLSARLDLSQPEIREPFLAAEGRFYGQQTFGTSLNRRTQLRLLECGQPIAFRRILVRPLATNASVFEPGIRPQVPAPR